MARERNIQYRIGFSGDVSQLEAAVRKATTALNQLGTSPDKLRAGLDGAARSALELSNYLTNAFNVNTGKLDLTKFRQSIAASGKDLAAYAKDLSDLGPDGREAFLSLANAIGRAELPLKRANNIVKQFGTTLWNTARWRIVTSAINTIVRGLQQAYGYSKSLDASLNNIRIVTGKSADEMSRFAKQANAAAKNLSTTTTTYTDASLIYYQQGLEDREVNARTETTIKMANVTGQTASEISSQMTAIWNNFDDGTRSLERFGDSIVALGASTAASSKEIAEGLEKFAPVAQTVGLSFDYASAALTTIVATTRESASIAGSALKTLFGRLEGLKLGETLEDGTDLNKYSNALLAVGVNIKDATGNLKDMDQILDELGAKWQTLARDEQMALAETVGGVRQYTQLVALMDHWTDFQKNLATSKTSEGDLEKQAAIYAESWEAARNRIKAASEDIYDSLINPQQFIKLDDILTPFLTGIASAIDAIGGLTGFLPMVVMLMNQAFGDKIASSIRNTAVNIGLMTGAEQKRARALQESIISITEELNLGAEENSSMSTKLNMLGEEARLRAEVNSKYDSLNSFSKENINNELAILDVVKERAIKTAELVDRYREMAQAAKENIMATAVTKVKDPFSAEQSANSFLSQPFMNNMNKMAVTDLGAAVDELINKLTQVSQESAEISKLREAFSDTEKVTQDNIQAAQALLAKYQNVAAASDDVNVLKKAIQQLYIESANAGNAIGKALTNLKADPSAVKAYRNAMVELGNATNGAKGNLQQFNSTVDKVRGTLNSASATTMDWAETIVHIGSACSRAAMAVRALSTLVDVFSKDSQLSTTEKWIQGLMSVGMLTPLIKPVVDQLKNLKQGYGAAQAASTAFAEAQKATTAAQAAEAEAKTAFTEASTTAATRNASAQEFQARAEQMASEAAEKQTAAETAAAEAVRLKTAATEAAAAAEQQKLELQTMEAVSNDEVILQNSELAASEEAAAVANGSAAAAEKEAAIANDQAAAAAKRAAAAQRSANTAKGNATKANNAATIAEKNYGMAVEDTAKKLEEEAMAQQAAAEAKAAAQAASLMTAALAVYAAVVVGFALYFKKQKEAIQEANAKTIERADKAQEEIKANDELIESYDQLLETYKTTGEGKEQLAEKAKEAAAAFGVEGAALAELTGDYDEFTRQLRENAKAQLEVRKGTLLSGAEAAVNNLVLDNKLRQRQFYSSDTEQAFRDSEVLGQYVKQDTNYYGSQGPAYFDWGSAVVEGDPIKSLGNLQAIRDELLRLTKDTNDTVAKAAFNRLKDIESELEKVEGYVQEIAEIDIRLSIPDDISTLAEYDKFVEDATEIARQYNVELSKIPALVESIASTNGLSKWVQIKNIQEDLIASFKQYPNLINQIDEAFKGVTDLATAQAYAYFPWGTAEEDSAEYELLMRQTKAYVQSLNDGAKASLNYANATKLLQQVQSNSGLKAKDLKEFSTLLGGDQELVNFLQKTDEQRLTQVNELIQNSFKAQQQERETAIRNLEALKAAAERARDESKEGLTDEDIEAYTQGQDAWNEAIIKSKAYFEELKDVSSITDRNTIMTDWKNSLLGLGLTQEEVDEIVATADIEDIVKAIDDKFSKILEDMDVGGKIATYIYNKTKALFFGEQIESTQQDIIIDEAQENDRLKRNAENAKSFNELNKALKTGNTNQDNYNKRLIELAKQTPKAKNAIAELDKVMRGAADATKTLEQAIYDVQQAMRDDAFATAIQKVGELNENLTKSGSKIGQRSEKQSEADYSSNIKGMADAFSEAYGYTVDAYWVETHPELIEKALSKDPEIVKKAAQEIDWSTYWNSQEVEAQIDSFVTKGTTAKELIDVLTGSTIFIDGKINVQDIIDGAYKAGASVTDLANLLLMLAGSGISFSVSADLERIASLMNTINTSENADQVIDAYQQLAELMQGGDQGITITPTGNATTPYVPKSSGGGGGNNKDDKDHKKYMEDLEDRYHEINRLIERQTRLLTELDKQISRAYGTKRLELYKQKQKEIQQQIAYLTEKSRQAGENLEKDKAVLQGLTVNEKTNTKLFEGFDIEFGIGQEISNYQDVLEQIKDAYNDFIKRYEEAIASGNQTLIEELKKQKEMEDLIFQERLDALKRYEDSLNNINTTRHELDDQKRAAEDNLLDEITYKIKVAVDVRDAKKAFNDFAKEIEESFGDALTHMLKAMPFSADNAQAEMDMYQHYFEEYEALQQRLREANEFTDVSAIMDELRNLEDRIIESGERLLEFLDEVENMFVDALEAAAERFAFFTNQIAHNTDMIGMIKELYTLQGVTYKTAKGFERLQNASMGQYQGYLRQAELNKQWYDEASTKLAAAEEALAGVEETDIRYDALKKNRDALLEEANKAQKAMLENSKAAMEMARQMALDEVDRASYELEQRMTNGLGFDLMKDKYDHLIEASERYLDPVEESLETAAWYSKLQADIDKSINNRHKERLKDLQEEIDLRRKNNTLSQYDLDLLEARYKILQAEMDLEDARNNKTQLRLVRDSNGNWNYQYTANTGDIEDKEQELLKAKKDEYEITKNRVRELNDELLAMAQEYAEKDAQIRKDVINGILTEEEGQRRLKELQEYYEGKAEYLKTELDIAQADMSSAAVTSQVLAAALSESVFNSSDDTIKAIVSAFKTDGHLQLIEAATGELDDLATLLAGNADKFRDNTKDVRQHIAGIISAGAEYGGMSIGDFLQELGTTPEKITSELGGAPGAFDEIFLNGQGSIADILAQTAGQFNTDIIGMGKIITDNFIPALQDHIPKADQIFADLQDRIEHVADAIGVDPNNLDDMVNTLADDTDRLYYEGQNAITGMWEQLTAIQELQNAYLQWAYEIQDVINKLKELAAATRDTIVNPPTPDIPTPGDDDDDDEPENPTQPTPEPEPEDSEGKYGATVEFRGNSSDPNGRQFYTTKGTFTLRGTAGDNYAGSDAEAREIQNAFDRVGYAAVLQWLANGGILDMKKLGFRSGGYTGNWEGDDGRLALLHKKELVLNAEDTENMLAAVEAVRGISDSLFTNIGRQLDGNAMANMALLGSRFGTPSMAAAGSQTIEQRVTIESVSFPNVTSSREIEEAFENLVNDAAQWARRRKS